MPDSPFDWSKSTAETNVEQSTEVTTEVAQPPVEAQPTAEASVQVETQPEPEPAEPSQTLCYRAMASGVSKCVAQTQLRKLDDHPDKLKTLETAADQYVFAQRWNNLKRWLAEQEKPTQESKAESKS